MLYRVRNYLNYAYFRRRTRDIVKTPPTPCRPDEACEVHTMLSARDLPLYLVAAKSFLRFHSTVSVVIHDDGSLDRNCTEALGKHVPGCRVVRAAEANRVAEQALQSWPLLRRFRGLDCSWRRLVDTELWSRASKRIIMDSDIVTLKPLNDLMDWAESGDRPFLMGMPPPRPFSPRAAASALVPVRAHIQTKFKAKVLELAAAMGVPAAFEDGATGGFYGCRAEDMAFPRIEQLLKVSLEMGVPMEEWGGEQCVVIFLLSIAGAFRLDPSRYVNFAPDAADGIATAALVHFYGTHRFWKNLYSRFAAQVVRELHKVEAAAVCHR